MKLQKVKAAVFDLDGTLLDTLADIGTGANFALCQFGYPTYPVRDYAQKIGHGIKNLFRTALPVGSSDEDVAKVNAVYQAYYPEHCTVHTTIFPGVQAFLDGLTARGIQLAVISNKTEATSLKVMAHYFPNYEWKFIWGNNGKRPLKPATEAGHLACEELGISPEEIMFIGDGDTDMEFASRMGFVAVGVTWGYRDPELLKAAGADLLIDSFDQLLEMM